LYFSSLESCSPLKKEDYRVNRAMYAMMHFLYDKEERIVLLTNIIEDTPLYSGDDLTKPDSNGTRG
jgi:hypothetical protein